MRYGVFIALGLALGLACSLADELEGAACRGEADCDRSQSCVKTLHQLESGVGQCSSNGSCVAGDQIGCQCDGQACSNFELAPVQHRKMTDATDAALCFCCQSAADCGMDKEPVIADVDTASGTATCSCCPICDTEDMQERIEDDDGNIIECDCIEPMTSTGGTSGSSSTE